jgi:hypothetical protein
MKKDKIETKIIKCSECDQEIESCDYCGAIFEKGECIYCSPRDFDNHFCTQCSDSEGKAV